jgi:hypothetical protein
MSRIGASGSAERESEGAVSQRIAVLGGTGPEGLGLAYRWARAGESIAIGSRDPRRAEETARQLAQRVGGGTDIAGMDNASAVAQAEIVVLTVPFSGHATLLKQLKAAWRPGTIVIDTTVPLAATVGGAATRTLGVWQGSAAEETAELVPQGVSVAAAFQNLSAELLTSDAPVDCDVLVCSDNQRAKEVASGLVAKIPGARALDAGRLENARVAEQITALLITLNMRYKVHAAGIRFTGLPLK